MSMYRFIARRSVEIVLILFIIATLTFSLFRFLPSDPVGLMMDPYATPKKKEMQRELWGLDKSIAEQSVIFMKNFLRGEFGTSFWSGRNVYDIITERLP